MAPTGDRPQAEGRARATFSTQFLFEACRRDHLDAPRAFGFGYASDTAPIGSETMNAQSSLVSSPCRVSEGNMGNRKGRGGLSLPFNFRIADETILVLNNSMTFYRAMSAFRTLVTAKPAVTAAAVGARPTPGCGLPTTLGIDPNHQWRCTSRNAVRSEEIVRRRWR